MKRLTLALCAVAFVAAGARADEKKAPARVPFELLKTQHMAVMVKVNGKGPFKLIFDTGAPVTLINNKVAREAGLIDKNVKGPVMPLFPGLGQYKAKTLEVGGLKAENMDVIVMDHPTVTAISKALGPIDGIVGFSFFARYKMTIDYQAKEMTFVPVKFQPQNTMDRMISLLSDPEKKKAKVLAPAGQWGFSVAKEADDTEPGVNVKKVLAGSPVAAAGLKAGDRLLTLAGRWTDTVADTYAAASHVKPGMSARLVVKRDGKNVELTVKVQSGL
jgi:hypothetical protein